MKKTFGFVLLFVFGVCGPSHADLISTGSLTSAVTQGSSINDEFGNGAGPAVNFVSGDSSGLTLVSLDDFNGIAGQHTLTFDGAGYTGTGSASTLTVNLPTEVAGQQLDIIGGGAGFLGRFQGNPFVSSGDFENDDAWGIITNRSTVTFAFSGDGGAEAPVSAFGVTINRNNAGHSIIVNRLDDEGNEFTTTYSIGVASRGFFGIQSDQANIKSVAFSQSVNNQFGFDDVSFSTQTVQAVPEPSSALLIGLVMLGAATLRRKS